MTDRGFEVPADLVDDEPTLSRDILEAVPVDKILDLMHKAMDQGMKEWNKLTELEERVAACETYMTEAIDPFIEKQIELEERVAWLEEIYDVYVPDDDKRPAPDTTGDTGEVTRLPYEELD